MVFEAVYDAKRRFQRVPSDSGAAALPPRATGMSRDRATYYCATDIHTVDI